MGSADQPQSPLGEGGSGAPPRSSFALLVLAWAAVLLPLAWGLYQTIVKASQLFR